jgi:hypothetical protein
MHGASAKSMYGLGGKKLEQASTEVVENTGVMWRKPYRVSEDDLETATRERLDDWYMDRTKSRN